MKKRIRMWTLIVVVFFILFTVICIKTKWIDNTFIQSVVGAFFGTLAGAFLIFVFQLRMERTRFYREIFNEGQKIMGEQTAWRKLENGVWENVEFRNAVGIATWINDPLGLDGKNHLELHIKNFSDCKNIIWNGVAYRVDDGFCVASKGLQEYSTWFKLLMDGLDSGLITPSQIQTMWRIIADPLYPAGKYTLDNSPGMRSWLEFFLLNRVMHKSAFPFKKKNLKNIKKIFESIFSKNERTDKALEKEIGNYYNVRKIIEEYVPSREYLARKGKDQKNK
jgi:hypothetical protein